MPTTLHDRVTGRNRTASYNRDPLQLMDGGEYASRTIRFPGGESYAVDRITFDGPSIDWVRSEHASLPDPAWTWTDPAGHLHQRDPETGTWPNLTEYGRHIECDGSCGGVCEGEGYSAPAWKCSLCGAEAEPRFVPDREAMGRGIPVITLQGQYRLTVTSPNGHRPVEFGGVTVEHNAVRFNAKTGERYDAGTIVTTSGLPEPVDAVIVQADGRETPLKVLLIADESVRSMRRGSAVWTGQCINVGSL